MSQNDRLLREKGVPILNEEDRQALRDKWQNQTWDDMLLSLHEYGKYIMLRPTGFGKTYTCSKAVTIGEDAAVWGRFQLYSDAEWAKVKAALYEKLSWIGTEEFNLPLNNGEQLYDRKLAEICKKKVIFVYPSDILKVTFGEQENAVRNEDRIIYETYSMVQSRWGDPKYLWEDMDIENVGLVIFDEVQRMGAVNTTKALDVAIPILEKLGIPYIGASATPERRTGPDVVEKYFTYRHDGGKLTYCWGEHIYTLTDAFKSGLIIPPYYQYIDEDKERVKKARQTRNSMLKSLKAEYAEGESKGEHVSFESIEDLERAVIKNSSKIVHDSMLELYDCDKDLITMDEELPVVDKGSLDRPEKLPKYMRFLVFCPRIEDLRERTKEEIEESHKKKNRTKEEMKNIYGTMLETTRDDFEEAFGRYGYTVRTTVVSSKDKKEKENVKMLGSKSLDEVAAEQTLGTPDMVIDLVFSVNMLNIGYHVASITGLVLKRWTGSNQIYYQQLGRCLSAISSLIPIVYDFVRSIDSRGISAPLYNVDESRKSTTENADGTEAIEYKDKKKKDGDDDGTGGPSGPRDVNYIDPKYVTVGMTSASVEDILRRAKVYSERISSCALFNQSYEIYRGCVKLNQRDMTIEGHEKLPALSQATRVAIVKQLKSRGVNVEIENRDINPYFGITEKDSQDVKKAKLTQNFLANLQWLADNNKEVFVSYIALQHYMAQKKGGRAGNDFLGNEVNSILAFVKDAEDGETSTDEKSGLRLKVILDGERRADFNNDSDIQDLLRSKGFDARTDLYTYTKKAS